MSHVRLRIACLAASVAATSLFAAAGSQAPDTQITTLKTSARLVVVDVVVTDSKQAAIHNLKATDFTLMENGTPQRVTGFEEHTAPSSVQAVKIQPIRLPPGIFTNFAPMPPGTAITVLLLDALNTQMKDQSYVHNQLLQFLKNTPPGTRIAIFVLNDRLRMLQGFTSDLTQLRSVVERTAPGSSMLLTDSSGRHDDVGSGAPALASETMSQIAGPDMAELITNVRQSEAMQASADTQNRAKQTLDAMNQLAHYLSGIQGRKNLIWFSGSFPITLFPDPGIAHPFEVVASSADEFRETTRLLAQAQVAVYPIDARGLQTSQSVIGNDSGPQNAGRGVAMALNKFSQDNANEHSTMYQMAAATGGRAFVDVNGLSEAVAKAIDSGSNYYTLSYTPTDARRNGEFRKIQIKLKEKGFTLNYRNGYYADEPEGKHKGTEFAAAKPTSPNTITRAMMRGAPVATEILLKLQVLPASASEEPAIFPGNILMPNPATKVTAKGPFRRYAIDIATDTNDVQIIPTPDGHYQFAVEVLTFVYDTNGVLINTAAQKARGNLSASTFANMRRTGLPFHQEISVPVAGDYYLRISVHDLETDRIGAVELPVASVAKLAPSNVQLH